MTKSDNSQCRSSFGRVPGSASLPRWARRSGFSVGLDEVKQKAAQYLSQQYTNPDGEMICQVCKAVVPFKLDDGNHYFENVEFLSDLRKRHYQNYLALCPNHAAMFQHANGSADLMRDMFAALTGNELEVVLAQRDTTVYFSRTHIVDLKEVVRVDQAGRLPGEVADAGFK